MSVVTGSASTCCSRFAVFAFICSTLMACGTSIAPDAGSDSGLLSSRSGLAVVAVVAAPDVELDMSAQAAATLLADTLLASGRGPVTPLPRVRVSLGAQRHGVVSREFASTGRIVNDTLQQVMATPLDARTGLLVRIERNDVDLLEPVVEGDSGGSTVSSNDRQTVVLSSRRQVRVLATALDLTTGSVIWTRAWTAAPMARTDYVRYTGSSLPGSLSASIANSVVNGLRGPSAPPPPALDVALDAIFRELATGLPAR